MLKALGCSSDRAAHGEERAAGGRRAAAAPRHRRRLQIQPDRRGELRQPGAPGAHGRPPRHGQTARG